VIWAAQRGLADAAASQTVPHDQFAAELRRKWLTIEEAHLDLAEQRLADYRRDPDGARSAFDILDELESRSVFRNACSREPPEQPPERPDP
jgi:hypothetical protein